MNYDDLAKTIVSSCGGEDNFVNFSHCATRLRFSLKDRKKFNKEQLEEENDILGVREHNGTIQLIIGTNVPNLYEAITKDIEVKEKNLKSEDKISSKKNTENEEKSALDKVLATISAIFTPYIPILATSGILLGLISILTSFGVIAEESATYATFNAMGNALIYFFPILLAYTAAERFGGNPYVGVIIGASIMHPSLHNLLEPGANLDFLGIPYIGMDFSNTVIPIIVSMWVFGHLERNLKRWLAESLQFLLVPLLSILIMVPLTLIVFGPIGGLLANGIAWVYQLSLGGNLIVFSTLIGALFIFVIMFGLHWIVLPMQLQILAEQGYEYSLAAGGMGNYALLGITLAILLFHREKKMKEVAGSAFFVNIISGITEPGLYGICLKDKRYFLALIAGGAAGGLVQGIFQVYTEAFAFSGIIGLPAFMAAREIFPYYLLSIIISISVGFIVTLFLDRKVYRGFKQKIEK